jgi:hypothetical protein
MCTSIQSNVIIFEPLGLRSVIVVVIILCSMIIINIVLTL